MKSKAKPGTSLKTAYDRSRVPLYIQVATVLRQRIETGFWGSGDRIPTLEKLEQEFQVARVTIRQAVDILRQEDLLYCRQGRGTFVTQKSNPGRWLKLATDWDELAASLRGGVPRVIRMEGLSPCPSLGEGEGRPAPDYVMLRTVQSKDGAPYGVVNLKLARHIFELDPEGFMSRPALPILAERREVAIKTATHSITVGGGDPDVADLLQISLSSPTVKCRCLVTDKEDVAIYVADIVYRSDCVRLDIDLLADRKATPPRRESGANPIALPRSQSAA